MVDRPRARRTRAPVPAAPVGPLTLPLPCGKDTVAETLPDGSLRLTGRLHVEALLAFVEVVVAGIAGGTLELPARVEVGFKDESSKITRGDAATRAEWARTIGRFSKVALTAPGALWFEFALDCGCGARVEVARG